MSLTYSIVIPMREVEPLTREYEDLQLSLYSLCQRVEELNHRIRGEEVEYTSLIDVPHPPPLGETTCGFLYTVMNGDTPFFVARRFGTTVEAIVLANRIEDPHVIIPGQTLIIPALVYRVQRDDSLNLIASRFGVTTEGLIGANGLKPPFTLLSGQILVIPLPCEIEIPVPTPMIEGVCSIYYTVQPGDSVFTIAGRFSLSTHSIIEANGLEPPFTLFSDEQLLIPLMVNIYRVRPRDSLYNIAIKFGTTIDVLARFNNLSPPFKVLPGEWLTIVSPSMSSGVDERREKNHEKGP